MQDIKHLIAENTLAQADPSLSPSAKARFAFESSREIDKDLRLARIQMNLPEVPKNQLRSIFNFGTMSFAK